MSRIKLFLAILSSVLGLVLIVQNTTPVSAKLFFWSQSVSLSVLLLIAIGIGFVLGLCAALLMSAKRKKAG